MIVVRKTLVVFLAVVVLSAGATLTQGQRRSYRGTFRSVRQLILRIENRTTMQGEMRPRRFPARTG